MLLEIRDAEREKSVREFSANLNAMLAEQEARTDEKLRTAANDRDELWRLKPELQSLAERMSDVNSAMQKVRTHAEASANDVARIENHFSNEIAGLHAELTQVVDQQRAFRLSQNDQSEIERKLSVAVDEIERQLAIEREGLDHWGKGLRESFAAELIGVQARLSERQSQIEHRHLGFERWQEAIKASVDALEIQLKENLPSPTSQQESSRIDSDLNALLERVNRFETRADQAEERSAALSRDTDQRLGDLRREIGVLERSLNQRGLSTSDSIAQTVEEKLAAKLGELEERFTNQLNQYNRNVSECTRQAEAMASRAQHELAVLRTALESQNTASPVLTFSPALEEALCTKLCELEQKLTARFSQLENRDAERTEHLKMFATLESELAALKNSLSQVTDAPPDSSISNLRESTDKHMRELQRHLEEKLIVAEKRVEQAATDFNTEMAALRGQLTGQSGAVSPADPVVLALEAKLSAKIEELHHLMGERFGAFDSREADIKELKQTSQSVIQRLTRLGAEIQRPHDTVSALQTVAPRVEVSADAGPQGAMKFEENLAEIHARSEKEQLIKLQERMSAEIERVRAELKERSGRWKVRKTVS
jgi:DNA repair exonuclease SbcCD ATPase subunit